MNFNLLSMRTNINLFGNGEEVHRTLFWHSKGACILMIIFISAIISTLSTLYMKLGTRISETQLELKMKDLN